MKGMSDFRKIANKTTIVVHEAEKRLEFFFIGWSGPRNDTIDLDGVHSDSVMRDFITKIIEFGAMEIALLWLEIQVILLKDLENTLDNLSMLFHRLREDEYVI